MKEIKTLKPFTRFLMTIGELPSSYLISMTYEEQLLWFCNFLQNQVIPTVNNNAEAVTELQEFVSNYFDNLDVQDEIDHKLDEMALNGTLEEIISEYLNTQAITGFNNINDLKNSENLIDSSNIYLYGINDYNDGKGDFYKIRTITSSDTIDNFNIISLNNFPTLIAERIKNYNVNNVYFSSKVNINDDISSFLTSNNTNITLIIDSDCTISSSIKLTRCNIIGSNYSKKLTITSPLIIYNCVIENLHISTNNGDNYALQLGEAGENANNIIKNIYFTTCNYAIKSICENDNLLIKQCRMFSGNKFLELKVPDNQSPTAGAEICGNHINLSDSTLAIELYRFDTLNFHNNIVNNSDINVSIDRCWGLTYTNNHHETRRENLNYCIKLDNVQSAFISGNVLEGYSNYFNCNAVTNSVLNNNIKYDNNIEYLMNSLCYNNNILTSNSSISYSVNNNINNFDIKRKKTISGVTSYTLTAEDMSNYTEFIIATDVTNVICNYSVMKEAVNYHFMTASTNHTFNFSTDRGMNNSAATSLNVSRIGITIYFN